MASAAGEVLADVIARHWREIEQTFDRPAEWRTFSTKLLALLRALEQPDADVAKITAQIEELFVRSPAANKVLEQYLPSSTTRRRTRGGLGSPWASDEPKPAGRRPVPPPAAAPPPASGQPRPPAPVPPAKSPTPAPMAPPKPSRHTIINVLYGTDRAPLEAKNGRARYDDDGAEALSLGVATVSIPDRDTHVKGRLERPRWYRLEFRENVDKHVVITGLESVDEAQFIERARKAREQDGSANEALLFVHGFNVGFEDSILRTAQFAHDLEFAGLAIAYSWPSKNSLFGYSKDANVSGSSMFRLADFITLLRSKLDLQRLHIVAHSMGNRLLAAALNQHVLKAPPAAKTPLNQMVFAAPDIDPKTFGGFAQEFAAQCERCTLYASSSDLALTASKWIYGRARAGADAAAVFKYGVDAIDASKVDSSMLGHSYFSDKRVLLQDLSALLVKDCDPGKRFGLTEIAVGTGHYWQFDA